MKKISLALFLLLALAPPLTAADQDPGRRGRGRGGGVPSQGAEEDVKLLSRFDTDDDQVLGHDERLAAREYINAHPELRPPFRRGRQPPRTGLPGPKIAPGEVRVYPDTADLYDPDTLRTLFVEFEHDDWEQDLAAFWHTDVLVPASLTVDGVVYPDVGMSFRGNNSFTGVPEGLKRPLSLTMDFLHDQDLLGYRSLNLLNSNQDPTFLRSILYLDVSRDYIPALKANLVRVVINGESWGIYVNQQTFSPEFEREAFGKVSGTRWKSPNNSTGGGLSYLGEDIALYRRWYEMKGADDLEAWRALVAVTKVLDETPPEQLANALAPHMDVDMVLRFLALDIALVNNDGYWRDGSDFNVYRDAEGRFLLTPHDVNEGFRVGGRGGQPDPLTVLDDPNKALRKKLLVVPELRDRYLAYVGDIAGKWLDWNHLGPIVEKYQELIADDVAADTRKLDTTEAFTTGVYGPGDGSEPPATSIKGFADQRRAFLLGHPEVVAAAQDRPDFSGRWTNEPEVTEDPGVPGQGARGTGQRRGGGRRGGNRGGRGRRDRVGDMGSGWGSNLTIEQDAEQLTVEYAFFRRGDMQPPLKFSFALDGSETENTVAMGRGLQVEKSRTRWQGDKLAISTVYVFEHPATGEKVPYEVTRTLSLETPSSMVVEVTRGGLLGGPPSSTRTTYRRL